MTRRLIAGLLTLCMLVSLCPPNAFALRSSAAVVPETESTVVEPAAEEPKVEEPAAEEPKAEEPAAEEPAVEEPQTEDTPAEDPAAEDPQTEDPAAEDPKAEEETPKYATVNVNGSVKLTASAEDGGKWASDNIAAATVGAEKADAGEKNVAEVFGVAEGYTTVTYTKGDAVETWIVTVKAAPAEDTPSEDTPAEETPSETAEYTVYLTHALYVEGYGWFADQSVPTTVPASAFVDGKLDTSAYAYRRAGIVLTESKAITLENAAAGRGNAVLGYAVADGYRAVVKTGASGFATYSRYVGTFDDVTILPAGQVRVTVNVVKNDVPVQAPIVKIIPLDENGEATFTQTIAIDPHNTPAVDIGTITAEGVLTVPLTEADTDVTVTVTLTADPVTYTVRHWFQALDGSYVQDPANYADETLTSAYGEMTEAAAKEVPHFQAQAFDQVPLETEGTVITIHYNRDTYKLTYNTQGGSYVSPKTGMYQQTVNVFEDTTSSTLTCTREVHTHTAQPSDSANSGNVGTTIGCYTSTKHSFIVTWYTWELSCGKTEHIHTDSCYESSGEITPAPTRQGYTFGGWYLDEACTQPASTTMELTGDVTVYAKWIPGTATYTIVAMRQIWDNSTNSAYYAFAGSSTGTGTVGSNVTASSIWSGTGYGSPTLTSAVVKPDGSTIVYAQYPLIQYTFKFNLNNRRAYIQMSEGGTKYTGSNYTITAVLGEDISAKWPTASQIYGSSSTFRSWKPSNTNTEYVTKRFEVTTDMISGSSTTITYTAQWENDLTEYKVEYYLQDADGSGYTLSTRYSQTYYYSSGSNLSAKNIYGYTYQKSKDDDTTENGVKVFRFYYDRNLSDITYYYNATVLETKTDIRFGADISGSSYNFDPTAQAGLSDVYKFKGWYDNAECLGDPYNFTTMPGEDLALYAKFEADPVELEFVVQYQNPDGSLTTATVPYNGTAEYVTPDLLPGYDFVGWYEDAEFTTPFDFNKPLTQDTIIYAMVVESQYVDYTVKYLTDEDEVVSAPRTLRGKVDAKVIAKAVAPQGAYAGYIVDAAEKTLVLQRGVENEIVFRYKPVDQLRYKVEFRYGSEVILSRPEAQANAQAFPVTVTTTEAQTLLEKGYVLKNGINSQYVTLSGDNSQNVIVFELELKNFTITYNLNDADDTVKAGWPNPSNTNPNPPTYTVRSDDITLVNPVREGYEFLGWTMGEGTTGGSATFDRNVVIETGSTGDLSFVANWKKSDFKLTINYVYENGTAAADSYVNPKVTYNTPYSVNSPVIPGYTADQEIVSGTMHAADTTITVTYTENTPVTINYVAGEGGSVSLASEAVAPATGTATGSTATADPDYYFVNWTNSKGEVVGTNASFTPSKNADGIYEADTYTAHFAPKTVVNVTITGANSEGIYKGSAYTVNTADFTLGGDALPAGVTITLKETVSATVSRTDVGTTKMGLNADSFNINNVPYNYKVVITNVTDGYVTVNKRTVTLTSATLSKEYDGVALTNGENEITVTGNGFITGEGATYTFSGSQLIAGSSANAFTYTLNEGTKADNYDIAKVEGTLTVTNRTTKYAIEVEANSGTALYDGTEHTASGFKTLTFEVEGNTYTVSGLSASVTKTDAGTYTVEVTGTAVVKDAQDNDVTGQFAVTTKNGTLTINKRTVTLTSEGGSKAYDGMPLTKPDVKVTGDGFVAGEVSGITATGSVTYVSEGEVTNSITYTTGANFKADNYTINKIEGKLSITANTNEIVITADSASKTYDGTALTKNTYTYTDGVLAAGDELQVVVTGSQTDAGSSANVVTSYKVMRGETDVTANYTFGTSVNGTLTVNKRTVTLTSESASKVYDETALTRPDVTVSGEGFVAGEVTNITAIGTITDAGSVTNTISFTPTTAFKESNYQISKSEGTLTVTKQSISPTEPDTEDPDPNYLGVTVGDLGNLVYNGLSQEQEPVVKDKNKVDLVKGTDYTLSYSTDTTNVGTVTVTVTGIGNYTGTVTRTYEITPAPYTVTTYSAIKVYDGHRLTAGGQVNGLVNGETCTVNTTASRIEYGTTENKPYTLTWDTAKESNYEFKGETIGTLTIVRQSINPIDPPIPDPDGGVTIDPDQPYYGGVTVEDPADVMYNGESQKGLPVVTDAEGNTLVLNKDYTLSYSDDTVNVGTVTVTITGIGNYQGEFIHREGNGDGLYTRPVTYQITPRHVTLTSEGGTKPYDGTPLTKPGVAVGVDGFVAGEVSGLKATGTVTNVTETPVINTITYTTGADFKATNYIIEKAEGELSITKAEVGVVTVSGLRDTYWWTGAEREVTGFIHDGEDRLITVTIKDKDKAVARGTEVGRYYMGLKETDFTAESPNYYKVVVKVEDGYLDIVPINITVTVTVRGNRDTVTYDGNPHTVEGYEVVSAIANTGRDMGMDGITLKFKGDASVTGTEVGTYDMGLKAADFTVECDIYRVVRVVVEDGQLEITPAPEEPTEEIPDETVPLAPPEEIPDEPVPQAGPAWALINLILSILTVLASLLLLVGYFGKKEEEAEDENGNAILDAEGNNVMNDIKKRGGWRLASLVPAILSVIAFLLTENMRNPMILVDRWTLLMVIIAVVQVLVMLLSKKKTEDNTQEA